MFNYKKNSVWAENLTIVLQIGLTMAGCICFCFFIGLYLDRWVGTRGIFVTIMTLCGVFGGANVVYRQILEVTQKTGEQHVDGKNDTPAADAEEIRRTGSHHRHSAGSGIDSERP
ncbi:MAG: AtpZ/AtpI family protein [Desulfosarcinaceae bacterium]|nr:AtpZ/AtpI family protein [Desulfosarcinaceae bacterium]